MTLELEEELRQIGWFSQRRVDDAQVAEWLRMAVQYLGCHIFPEAVRVLREYGGLTFGSLHFSPEGSLISEDRTQWLYWEWQLNEVLFPIAYELGDIFIYALSSTGKVYGRGVCDIFVGDSFEEFLSNTVAYRKGKIKWSDNTPMHWTVEMDAEFNQLYKAVYETNNAD